MGCDEKRRRRRRNKPQVSLMVEMWLRYYEPNKPAILALPLILLPFCIRFLIPSLKMTLPLPLPLPHLWNVMHSWLTPPVLFLLLNLVICTIAVTSTRGRNNKEKKKKKKKKINNAARNAFGTHEQSYVEEEDEENTVEQTVSTPLVEPSNPMLWRKTRHKPHPPENPNSPPSPSLVDSAEPLPSLRNKSESPAFVRVLQVPPTSNLMRCLEDENEDGTSTNTTEELNAKADDFIQKFKHQLMLQRIQSYRERKGRVRECLGRPLPIPFKPTFVLNK